MIHRRALPALFILTALAGANPAAAQGIPQDVADRANEIINNAVNGAILFGSQDSIAAGTLNVDRRNGTESNMDIFKLRYEHGFGEASDKLEPFVVGNIGSYKQVDHFHPFFGGAGEDDFSRLMTFGVSAGGGVHWRPVDGLEISPAFTLVYSQVENDYDYNNADSQSVEPVIDNEIFNWDLDAWTYIPSIEVGYTHNLEKVELRGEVTYAHLFNDSFDSSSSIVSIHSDSGFLHSRVSAQGPLGVEVAAAPLDLRGTLSRSDIFGTARDGFPFSYFYEIGADLIADISERNYWVTEVSIGASYLTGDDVDGWRLGGGLSF